MTKRLLIDTDIIEMPNSRHFLHVTIWHKAVWVIGKWLIRLQVFEMLLGDMQFFVASSGLLPFGLGCGVRCVALTLSIFALNRLWEPGTTSSPRKRQMRERDREQGRGKLTRLKSGGGVGTREEPPPTATFDRPFCPKWTVPWIWSWLNDGLAKKFWKKKRLSYVD